MDLPAANLAPVKNIQREKANYVLKKAVGYGRNPKRVVHRPTVHVVATQVQQRPLQTIRM